MKAIEVKNLKKRFGKKWVVKDVSFEVNEGEIFGFLGRNGAGKTTTINMLTGISRPSEGSFKILGQEKLDLVKRDIGVMPDAANFYYEMNGIDHLKYLAEIKNLKINTEEAYNLLNMVGLGGSEKKKVKTYSFGMKKKLAVAQAMIGDPKLLFLDEPTSGLDIQSALEIQQIIQNLAAKKRTIFMTSHNLAEVEKICSRIAIMEDGVIKKYGTMEDLQEKYSNELLLSIEFGDISPDKIAQISDILSPFVLEAHYKEGRFYCRIKDRHVTPEIIFALGREQIIMFEVKQERATLEEIFLH